MHGLEWSRSLIFYMLLQSPAYALGCYCATLLSTISSSGVTECMLGLEVKHHK